MPKKVTILGASLGGLIAAAELKRLGFEVVVLEKGKTVGGLYNKVDTPFGIQELGMHVLYVNNAQFNHLKKIFGGDSFHVMTGSEVDIGACANFGKLFFNSHYPNVLGHRLEKIIYDEIVALPKRDYRSFNAREEATNRFGEVAGEQIVTPILEKLWSASAESLTKHSLHCFFDLRRMVVCDKVKADRLKADPWLNEVIGNPDQLRPQGQVYGGRMGLTFKECSNNLSDRAISWGINEGIEIRFEQNVAMVDNCLEVDGHRLEEDCDACIVAVPIQGLAAGVSDQVDQTELSIYYLQLSRPLLNQFPSYYILGHSAELEASRIVNYDAYSRENIFGTPSVVSVEVLHKEGGAPSVDTIAGEVSRLLSIEVRAFYKLPKSLKVFSPTLNNGEQLDRVRVGIENQFSSKPVYFTGMRTDTGIFFSHHTIGLAYETALECSKRLS